MKRMKGWLVVLLAVVVLTGVMSAYADDKEEGTIFEGVYINSVSLAGKTEEEAQLLISDYVEELLSKPILITMGNRYLEVMPEDIGLTWMNPQVYKEAYNVGRCGNLIKRYKEQKDLETTNIDLRTVFKADETLLRTLLQEKQETLSVEPINWSMKKDGKNIEYIPGTTGTLMNVEESYTLLVDYFANEYSLESTTPELIYSVAEPLGSEEELAMVKDTLGMFYTNYESDTPGRNQNVENGVSKINGTLLYPGEEFSVYKCVAPFTAENGYGEGYAYLNGEAIVSYGGGICQVSTTLYNAVIRAELEVTKRAPHSMTVDYVEPAEDAAIAGDYKDLRFVNNLEYPIYIEGYTSNFEAYFVIYGVETRSANRTISFESEIVEKNEPKPIIKEVEKPIGVLEKTQGIHIGYKAYLWKIVTENGVEVSREKLNTSNYQPSGARYNVGILSEYPEAVEAIKEAIKEVEETGDITILEEAVKYWSDEEIKARENGTATDTETETEDAE